MNIPKRFRKEFKPKTLDQKLLHKIQSNRKNRVARAKRLKATGDPGELTNEQKTQVSRSSGTSHQIARALGLTHSFVRSFMKGSGQV